MFKKLPFTNLLIESFSVIFAVLLALFVNEWREDISDKRAAADALDKIVIEIKENKSNLENSIDVHKKTISDLKQLVKIAGGNVPDSIFQGYNFELMKKISWEAAVLTDVIHNLDFKLVSKLSGIYAEQDFYSSLINKMMDRIVFESKYSNNDELVSTLKNHQKYFSVLLEIEQQLIAKYTSFLENQNI